MKGIIMYVRKKLEILKKSKSILNLKHIYEGDIRNGRYNGRGRIVYSNGDSYEGDFKNGHLHGIGKFLYKNGDFYEGEFKKSLFNGFGKLRCESNGESYRGEFENESPY